MGYFLQQKKARVWKGLASPWQLPMLTVPGGPAPQTNRHVTNLVFFIAFNLCVVPGPARAGLGWAPHPNEIYI